MADNRENILSRLVVVCAGVTGIASAERNRLDASGLLRPAVIVLDGAESKIETEYRVRYSRRQMMGLSPAIRIFTRADSGAEAGGIFNVYRGRLVKAILTDATLRSYVGTSGDIQYEDFSVSEPEPEPREYRAELTILFIYPFHLSDLS